MTIAEARLEVGHIAHDVSTAVVDASVAATRVVGQTWHAVSSATAHAYHAVTRTAEHVYQSSVHLVHTAVHDVAKVATATAEFVKNHAAAIGAFVISTAVFIGCDAALGIATGGVGAVAGAVACGALAGAVGNAVSYGITAAQTGKFSWSGLLQTTAEGAVMGAAAGGLGAGAGELLGGAASRLLASGAASDTTEAATAAAARGAANDGAAATADSSNVAALGEHAGEEPGGTAAEQESNLCTVGGQSFTARTKVLTATGALVAISKLHVGQKVLATNTKTGKTTAETVAAVLVHHDTDKYDLRIKTAQGTSVVETTRGHLFWDATGRRWVKAGALRYGTHLRTPSGGTATALSGWTARQATGWMWDLTIPGDHDFYIQAAATAVLVHNCPWGGGVIRKQNRLGMANGWITGRSLALLHRITGTVPAPNATVRDLLDLTAGNRQFADKAASAASRDDQQLLNSVFSPDSLQYMTVNPADRNILFEGNHRMFQLLASADDPESGITLDTRIYIHRYRGGG
jgi:hypothetical protein